MMHASALGKLHLIHSGAMFSSSSTTHWQLETTFHFPTIAIQCTLIAAYVETETLILPLQDSSPSQNKHTHTHTPGFDALGGGEGHIDLGEKYKVQGHLDRARADTVHIAL